MANKDDYLTEYRCFFENFAQTYNPHDQLPVKLGSYKLASFEVVGGIIDWTTQYLNQKKCPQSLLSPLIKIIIEEVRRLCRKETLACGFNPNSNAYDPLRLMQCVVTKTNEICLRYLDNSKLCSLPSPGPPYNMVSVCAIKNSRRRMEDRHVIIHDLNTLFVDEEVSPSSYYAIFDGHAGHDAAAYSCAHLHQYLGESKYFISDPEQALREAFLKTDTLFNDKCNLENFRSGTTALCVLLKHKEKTLYIAWVGDSQAVLVSQGQCIQCVHPHKPCREDEKKRIEQGGGTVIYWGAWRVNGQLAVSRAIGDMEYKPFVIAEPDIIEIPLSGAEDFIILGCDGLWDVMTEKDAARHVYEEIIHNPDDIESVSRHLVQLAKEEGSSDNISVIVVFLREPSKVAAEAHWATRHNLIMDTLDNTNATNPFANSNNGEIKQKDEYVMNIAEGFAQNGTQSLEFLKATNGKRTSHEFDVDDDLGPETAVDTIEDVLLSTTVLSAKNLMDEIVNNNSTLCEQEKATLETDTEIRKKRSSDEFENIQFVREETPTPPVDLVQETAGLVDNVAESGEDSEDEWNYIKGDQAEKESENPSQNDKEICELTSDTDADNMSQLNPNAAEFVPISPKRTTASPSYEKIVDDLVIAQSPRREPNDYDINVPNIQDFETEIKLRPSDVQECDNGSESEKATTPLTSQEIMENFLNGKTIEEIEFQPNTSPVKFGGPGEFHFGPNSSPFVTSVGFMDQTTKAVVGDDSNYLEDTDLEYSCNLNESRSSLRVEDSMNASFYQDKEIEENPFDLNKVQLLPENIDDFLEKPKEDEENSLLNTTISDLPDHEPLRDALVFTSTDPIESSSPILDKSPFDDESKLRTPVSSPAIPECRSPELERCETPPKCRSSTAESDMPVQSPIMEDDNFRIRSPILNDNQQRMDELTQELQSVVNVEEENVTKSPVLDLLDMSNAKLPVSPQIEFDIEEPASALEELCARSPILTLDVGTTNATSQLRSPIPDRELDSPVEDVTSSLKDSPLPVSSPMEKPISESASGQLNTVDAFMHHETESVATADMNSFLERSLLPDIASPLSGDDIQYNDAVLEDLEIKSEIIAPEFPIATITTPSEESKTEDLQKEEIKVDLVAVAAVSTAISATAIVGSVATEKKLASKPKTAALGAKKPLTKPASAPAKPLTKPLASRSTALQAKTSTTTNKTPTSASSKTTVKERKPIATRTVEKKPLLNGDSAKPLVKKATSGTTAAKQPITKAVPVKLNPTKTPTENKTRPATAPLPAARTTSKSTTVRTPPATTRTSASKSTTSTATKSTVIAAKPKLSTTTLKPKPLAPDTKKQMKETTNKQITSTTHSKVSSTAGRIATKSPATSSVPTKTASAKIDSKKPIELIRHNTAKPKTTGVVKKTKTVTNGVSTKEMTIGETLIKDDFPVRNDIDNSLASIN